MATVFYVDGTTLEIEATSVEAVCDFIGRNLEAVPAKDDETLLVHGEGKLVGRPLNLRATARMFYPGDVVVGTAILCSEEEMDYLNSL